MAEWYGAFTVKTKAHIRAVGFEPIIHLLLKRFASTILVQYLAERWWDSTYTFHIADKEMTVSSRDFHHLTSLRYDGVVIILEGDLGTQLVINLLGRRYSTYMICYFDIESDYWPLP